MSDRLRWVSCTLLLLYTLALVIGTHVPQPEIFLRGLSVNDRVLHLSAYLVLAILIAWQFSYWRPLTWRTMGAILVLLAGFAALDEITQIPVGRYADPVDWLADLIGATTGALAAAMLALVLRRVGIRLPGSMSASPQQQP